MQTEQIEETNRYFTVGDGGADYWIVARDVEHAKQILRDHGVEFVKDDGVSAPIDDPAFAEIEWVERTEKWAASKTVHFDDAPTAKDGKCKLSECALGDFFSTEW